jgi:hypothetical protein
VTADVAYDQRVFGAPITYLYVTKWPEAGFHVTAPIGAVRPDFPLGNDADAVRSILRRPELTINAAATDGYYEEKPTNVSSGRRQVTLGLDTRPFLLDGDLLCYTGVSYINDHYQSTGTTLAYPTGTIALQRDFTDLDDIGMQLTIANPQGSTPFSFDTLGAAHELDLRGQYGNASLVGGVVFQYDLEHHGLYTAKYSIGPNMHGVMPRITYDSRSRAIGVAADVIGLTY